MPNLSVSCTLTTEEMTYTSSSSMIGHGLCAGSSCSQECNEVVNEQSKEKMAAEMEGGLTKVLDTFCVESTPDCEVNVGPDNPSLAIE